MSSSLILDAEKEARHFNLGYLQLRLLSLSPNTVTALSSIPAPSRSHSFFNHTSQPTLFSTRSNLLARPSLPVSDTPILDYRPHSKSSSSPFMFFCLLLLKNLNAHTHTHCNIQTQNELLHLLCEKPLVLTNFLKVSQASSSSHALSTSCITHKRKWRSLLIIFCIPGCKQGRQ